jgi:signal transduction histidine kinase
VAVLVMVRRWAGRPAGADPAAGTAGGPADPEHATGDRTDDAERRLHELLLDLHRRSQNLLHRQLRLLDSMERRESDDETLGDLFRADHLANRMRRNVEKAIVLAGGTPGRRWRRPVPLVDVVRGAVSEVTEFVRVSTAQIEPASLVGAAVTDLMHLLAELIDNATTFAPAETRVRVSGRRQADGYQLVVTDTGPGMSDDDLATAHQVMSNPEPPGGGAWWGLYAVGRFAKRHGITVQLGRAPSGGLSAEVSLPAALLAVADQDGGVDSDETAVIHPAERSMAGPPTDRVARFRERVHGAGDSPDEARTTELPAVDSQWTTS